MKKRAQSISSRAYVVVERTKKKELMPCFGNSDNKRRIAMLLAENRDLKKQLVAQTNALIAAQAKQDAAQTENKRLSRNVSLSQKVILEEIEEAKRYRRAIRKERRLRKRAEAEKAVEETKASRFLSAR